MRTKRKKTKRLIIKRAIIVLSFSVILTGIFLCGFYICKSVIRTKNVEIAASKINGFENVNINQDELKVTPNQRKKITLAFGGDVLLEKNIEKEIEKQGSKYVFQEVFDVLNSADVSMVNLETPVSTRGEKEKDKQYTFRAKPSSLDAISAGSIDIVSIANNHILDFGQDALRDTISLLKKNNILFTGAGENIDDASKPVYITKNNTKIAFIASSHVVPFVSWKADNNKLGVFTTYDPTRLLTEISNAKKEADYVVIYVHWGEESHEKPVSHQTNLAKKYIDAGADVVVGSHPHVLQGVEFYKGKIIAYSLGNFVFTNVKRDTAILNVTLEDNNVLGVKIIPCEIRNYRPALQEDKEKAGTLLRKIQNISTNVNINSGGDVISK